MFRICILNRYAHKLLKENRRYAGHSKWQNIKHQKEENDANRAVLFASLRNQIKVAIIEGGSMKPDSNLKLARVLEQCKKVNMPVTSIEEIFKKLARSKGTSQSTLVEVTGPLNCIMIIKLMSDNLFEAKMHLKNALKKINSKVTEGSLKNTFSHNGIIIVKKQKELDKAMEDAINIGATDIEEIKDDDNVYYKLKCEPQLLPKIVTQLNALNYDIVTTKEEIIPFFTIKLNNEDLQIIKLAQEKLLKLNEVHEIYDNINRDDISD